MKSIEDDEDEDLSEDELEVSFHILPVSSSWKPAKAELFTAPTTFSTCAHLPFLGYAALTAFGGCQSQGVSHVQ